MTHGAKTSTSPRMLPVLGGDACGPVPGKQWYEQRVEQLRGAVA